jgi:hypothetical protein
MGTTDSHTLSAVLTGLVALAGAFGLNKVLTYRSENRRTNAGARKEDAEADVNVAQQALKISRHSDKEAATARRESSRNREYIDRLIQHIYGLHGIMVAAGLPVPPIPGWPEERREGDEPEEETDDKPE